MDYIRFKSRVQWIRLGAIMLSCIPAMSIDSHLQ